MKNLKNPVTTIYRNNALQDILNVEKIELQDGDYEIILSQRLNGERLDLMIGFDRFTENEDGTICNSENDTNHYYLEIWQNWEEEESDEPIVCYWLSDDPNEREEIFYEAISYMTTFLIEQYLKEVK